ncbi:hypothetical protein ACFQFQ_22400 [Sulfitobacter porphyrae]|uniref:Uncharacterized protein n=1 Tax=Sulfitobacter porphyrae TaxID=1246864 RepID=A0ABW2B7K0_9RHOB
MPPPFGATSAKQSPPIPVICGSTTAMTADPAMAASIAVPPSRRTCMAASVARGCEVATMASIAWTADRPGK